MRREENRRMRKAWLWLATFLASFVMMAWTAFAGGEMIAPGAHITWSLNEETGTLTLTGSGAMYDADTANGIYFEWYGMKDKIDKIVVGKGITHIGSGAFYWMDHAASISLPSTVVSIGKGAFENCKSLKEITLPDGLKTAIGEDMFWGCEALTSLRIPNGVPSIGEAAFYNCKFLKAVSIPDSVTSIGENAFEKCTALERITVPGHVASIGSHAFYGCASLKTVTLASGVKHIGEYAFYGSGLTAVTFPASLQSIGSCAFYYMSSLKTITFTGSQPAIAKDAFSGVRATAYYPASWKGTPKLEYDYLSWKATGKTPGVFGGTQLKKGAVLKDAKTNASYKVTGKNTVTYQKPVKKKASVSIPSSVTLNGVKCKVTAIAANAFKNNKKIKSVTIPSTVSSIGKNAFYNCKNLKKITVRTKKLTKKNVGSNAFKKIYAKAVIKVPSGRQKAYKTLLKARGAGKKCVVK